MPLFYVEYRLLEIQTVDEAEFLFEMQSRDYFYLCFE